MTADAAYDVRLKAGELSRDGQSGVTGPLKGNHHEAYAFPLGPESGLADHFERGKLRIPRPGLLWFDRRCFASEDLLLTALQHRIDHIPGIVQVDQGIYIQGFIEGRTLDSRHGPGRGLSLRHLGQLGDFFEQLVAIDPKALEEGSVRRVCAAVDRTGDGDSAGFLDRLIRFTEDRVYLGHGAPYRRLFEDLGVTAEPLERLRRRAAGLRKRPFALLHCDLHRKNLIVDRSGDLWVIDWELAMIGDPLYDLATHLHLMRYPKHEEKQVTDLWEGAVERARPGSSDGWREDLPVLLAYKRAQSVYTDVIRAALLLGAGGGSGSGPEGRWRVYQAAWRVHGVLAAAKASYEPAEAPTLRQVRDAYRNWLRTRATPARPSPLTPSAP